MKRIAILFATLLVLAACGTQTPDGLVFRTADPNLSVGFPLLPAPPLPTLAPTPEPTVMPTAEPTATPECLIKGNISSSGEAIYHVPGGASYEATQIDPTRKNAAGLVEQYFCTEEEAVAGGFRKAAR